MLAALRSWGKITFLLSDSDPDFVDVVMDASLGPDWDRFFDVSLAKCKKPLF